MHPSCGKAPIIAHVAGEAPIQLSRPAKSCPYTSKKSGCRWRSPPDKSCGFAQSCDSSLPYALLIRVVLFSGRRSSCMHKAGAELSAASVSLALYHNTDHPRSAIASISRDAANLSRRGESLAARRIPSRRIAHAKKTVISLRRLQIPFFYRTINIYRRPKIHKKEYHDGSYCSSH